MVYWCGEGWGEVGRPGGEGWCGGAEAKTKGEGVGEGAGGAWVKH